MSMLYQPTCRYTMRAKCTVIACAIMPYLLGMMLLIAVDRLVTSMEHLWTGVIALGIYACVGLGFLWLMDRSLRQTRTNTW
jgi:hypothetical protein